MKKLPTHTTRYFAAQDYWLVFHRGMKGPWRHRTVQGIWLTVEYNNDENAMVCTYENEDGKTIKKVHFIAKSWAY